MTIPVAAKKSIHGHVSTYYLMFFDTAVSRRTVSLLVMVRGRYCSQISQSKKPGARQGKRVTGLDKYLSPSTGVTAIGFHDSPQ